MVIDARKVYNESFNAERYQAFLDSITQATNHTPPFRIAESPIFVTEGLKAKIFQACQDITKTISRPDFKELTKGSLRSEYEVPNETDKSLFLQYDFGITIDENGDYSPRLIEVQGFPTLYFYQDLVANAYREHFDIIDGYSHLFGGLNSDSYKDLLGKAIVGNHDPKNVILLEIEPDKQATQIDYICTSAALGIKTICVSDLKVDGKNVYYIENNKKIEVNRIYNRVIFDELVGRKDLQRQFLFTKEANVEWAGHPNWFFRISKYSMPLFDSPYVPKTYYLDQIEIPKNLEDYVLKPLYSFSGAGVVFNVKPENIESIEDRSQFILQEKIEYSQVVQSPNGKVKCEIRMLLLWEEGSDKPRIINNLARLSRGELIGVKYNKDKDWVGGSVAFFPH